MSKYDHFVCLTEAVRWSSTILNMDSEITLGYKDTKIYLSGLREISRADIFF